jgi:hypothetical protein
LRDQARHRNPNRDAVLLAAGDIVRMPPSS